jgi:hypothetical protein
MAFTGTGPFVEQYFEDPKVRLSQSLLEQCRKDITGHRLPRFTEFCSKSADAFNARISW